MSDEINPEKPVANASKFGRWMFIALFWLAVLSVVGWLSWQDERKKRSTHIPQELEGSRIGVSINASRYNHFVVEGLVNGYPVTFLVDTGASSVSIPALVAEKAGLEGGRWIPVSTANGTINVQTARIDKLEIGPLALNAVTATINPRHDDDVALLGMSFLSYFDLLQRDGVLEIRTP